MPQREQCLWITEKRGIYLEPWTPEGKPTVYSLVPVRSGTDGKVYMNWALFSHYDKDTRQQVKDTKDRVVKIYLGTKEETIKALHSLLQGLGGDIQGAASVPDDVEVPF